MKKKLLLVSMMSVFAAGLMSCATTGDLEKVQAQERLNSAKADQAMQDAQEAKVAADSAVQRADAAAARAEEATKRAEERERIAEEKINRADSVFQRSMNK